MRELLLSTGGNGSPKGGRGGGQGAENGFRSSNPFLAICPGCHLTAVPSVKRRDEKDSITLYDDAVERAQTGERPT